MTESSAKQQAKSNRVEVEQRPLPAYLVPPLDMGHAEENALFWSAIMAHKLLILLMVLSCAGIGALVAFSLTPVYRAEVLLSPVSDSGSRKELSGLTGQLESIASLAGIAKEGDDNKQEAIATLKSRAFTLQFIKDENLLPTLFPDDWDSRGGNWDTKPGKTPPTSWDAYELFDEEVRQVTESRKTGLVTVAVEWQDPDLAALWANLLVSRINTHMRRRVIEEAEKSVEYLNKELNKTSIVEIQKAIYALIEEQVRRIMMANVREEYSFKVIDPAAAPDVDEYRKPKRGMIIGLSLVGGLTAGMVLALIRQRNSILRKQKAFYDS